MATVTVTVGGFPAALHPVATDANEEAAGVTALATSEADSDGNVRREVVATVAAGVGDSPPE